MEDTQKYNVISKNSVSIKSNGNKSQNNVNEEISSLTNLTITGEMYDNFFTDSVIIQKTDYEEELATKNEEKHGINKI